MRNISYSRITHYFVVAALSFCFFSPPLLFAQIEAHQKLSSTEGGFFGILDDGDFWGRSLSSLGDVDGDGVIDLAASAHFDDDGGTDRGAVWILFLNTDGTVRSFQKISDLEGGFNGELDDGDRFGGAVRGIGDLDGDGVVDLAVGSDHDDDGGSDRGAIWILFLNSDGTVREHVKISSSTPEFSGVLSDNDWFGSRIAVIGDLNEDDVIDLAVAAFRDDDGGTDRGAVWILFLNSDGTLNSYQKISSTDGDFTGIIDDGDLFGTALVSLGDLDGDDISDLAVGAQNDDDGGIDQGAVWILFMNSNGTVKAHQKISETVGGFTGVLDPQDFFGDSAASAGDLNGDNIVDLVVGASFDDDGGTDQGALWLLFLNSDGTVNSHQKVSDTEGGFSGALDPNDRFAEGMASLEDLNGDGFLDLAVGAIGDDDGGNDRGAIWILFTNYALPTGVEYVGSDLPDSYRLASNFPNPFHSRTSFQFDLPEAGHVTLKVYDTMGREVTTLVDQVLSAGTYNAAWSVDGIPSGLYLYRLQAGAFSQTGKMILVK